MLVLAAGMGALLQSVQVWLLFRLSVPRSVCSVYPLVFSSCFATIRRVLVVPQTPNPQQEQAGAGTGIGSGTGTRTGNDDRVRNNDNTGSGMHRSQG
ncbi:hypothetical protein B0O80DRAFT_464539 [Mortierella sp. GBAus27b]|nr:hypothetical protein B0O80DRAFT_464539 [Mortierella sp. GBAus27b]